MRVVVTGAGGHVGTNLVHALLAQGRDVHMLDLQPPTELIRAGATWAAIDVRDEPAVTAACDGASVIYHLAAVISVAGGRRGLVRSVNVDGVRAMARAAMRVGGIRFVHCSSVHAYDLMACRGQVINEQSPRAIDPKLPAYDRSKAAGEAALQEYVRVGLDAVIVNPTGVIGPKDPGPSRMGAVLLAAAQGRLPATISGAFDWVDVRDLVDTLMACESAGEIGANYLVGGHVASLSQLAKRAAMIGHTRGPLVNLPMWFARIFSPLATQIAQRSPHPLLFTFDSLHALESAPRVDSAQARSVLGHHARPLDQTLEDLLTQH